MNTTSALVVGVVLGALAVGCGGCPDIGCSAAVDARFEEPLGPGSYRLRLRTSGEGTPPGLSRKSGTGSVGAIRIRVVVTERWGE